MAGKLDPSKILKTFDGTGDVVSWLAKVDLVAKLTNVKDSAHLIPLYLEGGALALYLELSDSQKGDYSQLSQALLRAYSDSQFVAYAKVTGAKWSGEPVDVFANEIRKHAKGAGLSGPGLDQIVKLAFIMGFPDSISIELQQVEGIEGMKVEEIMNRARVLATNVGSSTVMAAQSQGGGGGLKCYECGGPHKIRFCPEKKERREFKCYRCDGKHMLQNCPYDAYGKAKKSGPEKEVCGVTGVAQETVNSSLIGVPVIQVQLNGRPVQALVDTGCTRSMVRVGLCHKTESNTVLVAFDNSKVRCSGIAHVEVGVGNMSVRQEVLVMDKIVGEIDMVIGMDVIERLGGVKVSGRQVQFGVKNVCAVTGEEKRKPVIVDKDFEAFFDGDHWEIRYFWNEKGAPVLKNTVSEYSSKLDDDKRKQYDAELDRWIADGILVPWEGEVGGIIPLMAVEQPTKGKIRPVLDFRELNESVNCHTGDDVTDVCSDKLREWRQLEGEGELVDLKAAYLQIRVARELWKYQLVRIKGKVYCLTRLGFGLNSAPRIMSKILKTVLAKDEEMKAATSSFIDDIMVNTSIVASDAVVTHLKKSGLVAKPPEALEGGAALGLRLEKNQDGILEFSRSNQLPEIPENLTKKELFSACGRLIGHYPCAGWLRVACSHMKRTALGSWGDYVGDEIRDRMREVMSEVEKSDPVKGVWRAPKSVSGSVWCDASDVAMGVVVEIGGVKVEDAAWLRKKDDFQHINVAELEAVLKGINLCAKWNLRDVTVLTDSATVLHWVRTMISEEKKIRTKGAAEILIKRRLGTLKSIIQELGMSVEVKLVKSDENKADVMTRVKKIRLVNQNTACPSVESVRDMHERHHFGVERSWFLAKQVDKEVEKELVKTVVRGCQRCQSIDPAPSTHISGDLGTDQPWERLAIDVTHYHGVPYLSMVDCGPGRFAIWRKLKGETGTEICQHLDNVFYERGPTKEVLMDNARAFHSTEMSDLLGKWGVRAFYRAAYRAEGNGIVERNHRTIKASAERANISPIDAVYWYNISPRYGQKAESVPQRSVTTYQWRLLGQEVKESEEKQARVNIGDEVWVKPGHARCTTQWRKGRVTGINSENNVEVEGVPRHILDIRSIVEPAGGEQEEEDVEDDENVPRRSRRERRAPAWMEDFEV